MRDLPPVRENGEAGAHRQHRLTGIIMALADSDFQKVLCVDRDMKTRFAGSTPRPVDWEPKYPFDLVIAYEDDATRNRAMLLYDRLAQQLLDDYDFQCAWWKFAHLREGSLMERATDDAIEANMIILSLDTAKGLTRWAREWIEAWVPNKIGTKSALVALQTLPAPPASQHPALTSQLHQYARQARMDLFLHSGDTDREHALYSLDAIHHRARAVTPILENILHLPPPQMLRGV